MSDSKKQPTLYDSLVEKAKNNRFISVIIVVFALITGAKGVAESIEYFAQKASGAKEEVVEKSSHNSSLSATKPDSLKITQDGNISKTSSKDTIGEEKQPLTSAKSNKKPSISLPTATKEKGDELSKIHKDLLEMFKQLDYCKRIEMDETGEVGVIFTDGVFIRFKIQDIRFEWRNSDYKLYAIVEGDKYGIFVHGKVFFKNPSDPDEKFFWADRNGNNWYFDFSKDDSEKVIQLFERYRKYVADKK